MKFDGVTFEAEHDEERLTSQLMRIRKLMEDKKWRTLAEISTATGAPEASASACLRDFRKKRHGFMVVERRIRGERKRGLYEYRLMPHGYESEYILKERRNRYREALELVWRHPDTTKRLKDDITEIFKKDKN